MCEELSLMGGETWKQRTNKDVTYARPGKDDTALALPLSALSQLVNLCEPQYSDQLRTVLEFFDFRQFSFQSHNHYPVRCAGRIITVIIRVHHNVHL